MPELHEYQEKAVDFIFERDRSMAIMPMGAGKTVIAATAIAELLKVGAVGRCLIVAPKRVAQLVWPAEWAKWHHVSDNHDLAICVGTAAQRFRALRSDAAVMVTNYENLVWLLKQPESATFDMLVLDETTRMKNPQSKRFKALRRRLAQFKIRVGLTGMPAPNGVIDLYAQVLCIDDGKALGSTLEAFRASFMDKLGPNAWDWREKHGAATMAATAMVPITYLIDDSVYVDQLPPLVTTDVMIELPAYARAVYDELAETYVTLLKSGVDVMAPSAGVLSGKLRQVVQGFLYERPGERAAEWMHQQKIDATMELIENLNGTPTLVAYQYQAELAALQKAYPAPHLGSGVSDAQAKRAIDAWNTGKLPVLYIHPASAGHGLNLQAGGNRIIWHTLPWSLDEYEQTNARLRRQGQEADQVWCHHVLAANTVDTTVVDALVRKRSLQDAILEGLEI